MIATFEKPIFLLKLKGFSLLILALVIYWHQSFSWPLFWSTVLFPDLALLAYLANASLGARLYNITHAKLIPSVLAVVAIQTSNALLSALALIWFAHIGFDRMLGYGLEYPEGFNFTHLGTIGRATEERHR